MKNKINLHGGALFFDLDGVLINTEPYKFLTYVETLIERGIPLGELFEKGFYEFYKKNCVGKSAQENIEEQRNWLNEHGYMLGCSWEEYREQRMRYYMPIQDEISLITENVNIIKSIKNIQPAVHHPLVIGDACTIYIVSRTEEERTRAILERAGIADCVEIAVEPEKKKQKYSRAVEMAKNRGIGLENCIAVEDSQQGVLEAKEFGLYVIAIPNEFTEFQDFSTTDSILDKEFVREKDPFTAFLEFFKATPAMKLKNRFGAIPGVYPQEGQKILEEWLRKNPNKLNPYATEITDILEKFQNFFDAGIRYKSIRREDRNTLTDSDYGIASEDYYSALHKLSYIINSVEKDRDFLDKFNESLKAAFDFWDTKNGSKS